MSCRFSPWHLEPVAILAPLVALSLSLLLSACAGTPPAVIPPPPRAKPVEAMLPCPPELSKLPDNFEHLPRDDQVRILELAHVADAAAYFPCSKKQAREANWIDGGKQ